VPEGGNCDVGSANRTRPVSRMHWPPAFDGPSLVRMRRSFQSKRTRYCGFCAFSRICWLSSIRQTVGPAPLAETNIE
jgi:hypothetical protein